jgi:hypothetical protein
MITLRIVATLLLLVAIAILWWPRQKRGPNPSSTPKIAPEVEDWLDQEAPGWRDKMTRGESVTIPAKRRPF